MALTATHHFMEGPDQPHDGEGIRGGMVIAVPFQPGEEERNNIAETKNAGSAQHAAGLAAGRKKIGPARQS